VTETQVWGLRHPETYEESRDYHDDLTGFIIDLRELGFSVHIVNSYGKPTLVIGNRRVNIGR